MKIWAFTRLFYGADWLETSVRSISSEVDRMFIFLTGPILGYGQARWRDEHGHPRPFPIDPDGAKGIAWSLSQEAGTNVRTLVNERGCHMEGQVSDWVNATIARFHETPDVVLVNECDHVWSGRVRESIEKWHRDPETRFAKVRQEELWRPPQADQWYQIPYRVNRVGPVLIDIARSGGVCPETKWHGWNEPIIEFWPHRPVFNLGYAVSADTMRWKVRCSKSLGDVGRDSAPDPNYVDGVYLAWKPGDGDLEISKHHRHNIPIVWPIGEEDPWKRSLGS